MPGLHALLAPSAAHRWLTCPGSIALCKDLPDIPSDFAREGTAAHKLAEICLREDNDAKTHIGRAYYIEDNEKGIPINWPVDTEMATYVQVYLDYVRQEATRFPLLIEQRLSLTPITGEPDAFGTADAVVIQGSTLIIIDLKYGRGVEVDAEDNEQLMIYAAAAREHYKLLGDFTDFKIVIVQPRRDHIDEFHFANLELDRLVANVKVVAPSALDGSGARVPSESACKFCKGKAICPELTGYVQTITAAKFDDITQLPAVDLAANMRAVPLVEDWCRANRAELERRMLVEGHKVVGWKIVEGRRGARAWTDAKIVETALKETGYTDNQIYKFSLITPTQAEKVFAADERTWAALQALITQSEGKPSVAPATDPRPEVGAVIDSFEVVV